LLDPSGMTPKDLIARIERFADAVIALCRAIPHDPLTIRLLTQLQDAATSTASNYRAACRAGSKAAFVSKLSIALEEADEAAGWLQRVENNRLAPAKEVGRLLQEANEISAILNASRETATGRRRRQA